MALKLKRPMAVIDLETTGFDVTTAKMVSIGITIIGVNGAIESTEEIFINPGIKIPQETTDVHGITDEMVKDCPSFEGVAAQIAEKLNDCDLAGYNIEKYDLPLLKCEFERVGITDFAQDAKVVDVMVIYHKNVHRDLSAAVKYYLNRQHEGAHSAGADAKATAEVLIKQITAHDLPKDTDGLHAYCHEKPEGYIDGEGLFIWKEDVAVINFGKMKGTTLQEALEKNRSYFEWIVGNNFSDEVKEIVRNALDGNFPAR